MVKKNFGSKRHPKWFSGRVNGVDEHAGHSGHRLFHVTYSDGDEEWMEVDQLQDIMLPPGAPSVSQILYICMEYDLFVIFLYKHNERTLGID